MRSAKMLGRNTRRRNITKQLINSNKDRQPERQKIMAEEGKLETERHLIKQYKQNIIFQNNQRTSKRRNLEEH